MSSIEIAPLLAVLTLLSQNLALGKQFPWSALPWDLGRMIWIALTFALLGLIFSRRLQKDALARISGALSSPLTWKALIVFQGLFQLYSYWHFRELGYRFPWPQLGLVAITMALIRRNRLGLAFLFSLGLQLCAIFTYPLNDTRSDMLPVIQTALTNWSHGVSPYLELILPSGKADHMPYLPGTLFSHWPAWALGLDLRWGQLFYRALWMGLVYRPLIKAETRTRDWMQLFALNPYWGFRHDLYFEVFLLFIALYWRYPRARWLTLPAMIVTRQWAWILAPFAVIDWIKNGSFAKRAALLLLGSVLIVGPLVLLLRPTTDLATFRSSILIFDQWLEHPAFIDDYGLTLAPLFYKLNLVRLLQPAQALACVMFFGFGALIRPQALMTCASICLVVFIALNPHFWLYFWLSPTLWALLGGLPPPPPQRK
ncbi:MAG: hypothetical protein P4M08_13590 [Oligoflexia bacterium]|nr:hypothetical protein [Oligoflexia bacterium]